MKINQNNINKIDNNLMDNTKNIFCEECTDDIILAKDNDVLTSESNEKKPKKLRKQCIHGERHDRCRECSKSSFCVHDKRKDGCRECCNKSNFCPHDKQKIKCKICNSDAVCLHGRFKNSCKDCGTVNLCEHGKIKSKCVDCDGSCVCIHKRQKAQCVECRGSQICIHTKRKADCVDCHGSQICIHKKNKSKCVICDGSCICVHKKIKTQCIICNGSSICLHKIQKASCIKCNGSRICIHTRQKSTCKKCHGGEICVHNKRKQYCKSCGGTSLCKSEWCDTYGNRKYEGYCVFCYTNLFPDKIMTRNYKTKELNVVDHIKEHYSEFTWVCDKRIQDGCSKKRPDLLLDLGTHIIIVEVDENAHTDYDCSCENKRLMELSKDVGYRPIVFIRFNPDQYTDINGKIIKSCWKINKVSGILQIDPKKEDEWKERIGTLCEQIQYWIDNQSEKMVEIIELFY